MKPNNNLEKTIRQKLSFSAGTELHDRMLNDVLKAQEKSQKTQSTVKQSNIRRIIMTNPVTKLAAAAVIFLAAGIGYYTLIKSDDVHYSEIVPIQEVLTGPLTHTFPDGSIAKLADGAKIKWLDSPDQRGFEHLAGAVDVTVAKGDGEFVVTTPYGEVKALGTKFSLELVDGTDSNTREQIKLLAVEVEEGSVQVSNGKGSSTVKASRKLIVEPDQKPYDYYQDENLPARLRERIQSMLEALSAGDSAAWMANYNIDYMYKLIKNQVEYDSNLFGGSKADAERLQKMGEDIDSPQELLERFTAMGGIKKASGEIYVRSVTLNDKGDHAVARCIEYAGENHIVGHNPQWHYFDNDWWQIDD